MALLLLLLIPMLIELKGVLNLLLELVFLLEEEGGVKED